MRTISSFAAHQGHTMSALSGASLPPLLKMRVDRALARGGGRASRDVRRTALGRVRP